jgi:hypothetical protein
MVGRLPGGGALFDARHNPAYRWDISPDAAKVLVAFWRRTDPGSGRLVHDFSDAGLDTRFLGDLYQDLSESARKKYALLQTPVFVEEFLLDRTLNEALAALPLAKVTVIDPTCGSGHFLLGAFGRLLAAWEREDPMASREVLAQRALDQVAGVDINPFAVAIARFRLLIAALGACGIDRLDRAPAFRMHVAVGDSLLHGDEPGQLALGDGGRGRFVRHAFSDEDLTSVNAILSRRYAVVVGNPPYITVKDRTLNTAYRQRYQTCHMKYALSVPFVERFWELTATDAGGGIAGWTAQITSNSFMKREFGKKLVEEFLPTVDLTHVLDTAGAYIPGHGTPTVILIGRGRRPVLPVVRAVMGIRGEPSTPSNPGEGQVWTSIVTNIDICGAVNAFVSVENADRITLATHPWSLGGGGASSLKQLIEGQSPSRLSDFAHSIGIVSFTLEDGAYLTDIGTAKRQRLDDKLLRPMVSGDELRDWALDGNQLAVFPYVQDFQVAVLQEFPEVLRFLWPNRTLLASSLMFGGQTKVECGMGWFEYGRLTSSKLRDPLSITFAEIATHNHFVLDRGGKVFNQTAPVIKLPAGTDEDTHLGLLGLLNSSTACFWLKQVCFPKGGDSVGTEGARVRKTLWEERYSFNGTNVGDFPIPKERPTDLAAQLDALAADRLQMHPETSVAEGVFDRVRLQHDRILLAQASEKSISLQEELDWRVYYLYRISKGRLDYVDEFDRPIDAPPVKLGERAFEIVFARKVAEGDEESTWFTRHGSTPVTEVPSHWPPAYRALVERRIEAIQSDPNINLIERPEYKRRWNQPGWEELEQEALTKWLLDRLESPAYWPTVALQTTRDLAARAAVDADFVQVAALLRGDGVALEPLIRELTTAEAVPFLPVLRYKPTGLEKRSVWERTWALQRQEDQVDAAVAASMAPRDGESEAAYGQRLAAAQKARREAEVGSIPRPPKYVAADFLNGTFWRLRGGLDVPKERFIAYPFCGREGDDAPVVGWAGWNHLQQAEALAGWYADRTQGDGWQGEQVVPMLAGMAELVPWLLQWHNALDPVLGDRPGDAYKGWLEEELLAQGVSRDALRRWKPPATRARRGRPRRQS